MSQQYPQQYPSGYNNLSNPLANNFNNPNIYNPNFFNPVFQNPQMEPHQKRHIVTDPLTHQIILYKSKFIPEDLREEFKSGLKKYINVNKAIVYGTLSYMAYSLFCVRKRWYRLTSSGVIALRKYLLLYIALCINSYK